jgi:hypothetical protein
VSKNKTPIQIQATSYLVLNCFVVIDQVFFNHEFIGYKLEAQKSVLPNRPEEYDQKLIAC